MVMYKKTIILLLAILSRVGCYKLMLFLKCVKLYLSVINRLAVL